MSGSGVQLILFSNLQMFSVPVCALAVTFTTENGWTISHREWSFSWGDGIGQFYNSFVSYDNDNSKVIVTF